MTDFSEQPETPGPQPRQGAKASCVEAGEKMELSLSSRFWVSLPVLACAVEEGMLSLDAAELDDEAASPPSVQDEVLHPASRQASRAAHTSRERIRLRIIACSSFYRFPAKAGGVSGYSSSILFRRAVVNCRVQDEFQPALCKLYKL